MSRLAIACSNYFKAVYSSQPTEQQSYSCPPPADPGGVPPALPGSPREAKDMPVSGFLHKPQEGVKYASSMDWRSEGAVTSVSWGVF